MKSLVNKLLKNLQKNIPILVLSKKQNKRKTDLLVCWIISKSKDRRSRQYKGIIKFVERQEDLRKAIGTSSKLIREV